MSDIGKTGLLFRISGAIPYLPNGSKTAEGKFLRLFETKDLF